MSVTDNRVVPHLAPEPLVNRKRGEPTKLSQDMEEVAAQAIAELRARGHVVRSIELTAWRDAKTEAAYLHLISLPKVAT